MIYNRYSTTKLLTASRQLHLLGHKAQHLQHRLPLPLTQDRTLVILEHDPPHGLARFAQLANKVARLDVPQFDAAVVPAADDEPVVVLQTGDRVVVCAYPLKAGVVDEVKDDDPAIGAARDEGVVR